MAVLDADPEHCREMCKFLGSQYPAAPVQTVSDLIIVLNNQNVRTVIIDIDTVPVDNLTIRNLKTRYPGICYLCVSERPFHPDLREALGCHVVACVRKPVDRSELSFWLKSIHHDHPEPEKKPYLI